jgi:hypothetical protein
VNYKLETKSELIETKSEQAKLVELTKNLETNIEMIMSRLGGLENISLHFIFSTHTYEVIVRNLIFKTHTHVK